MTPCITEVEVLGPDVAASRKDCTLEPRTAGAGPVGHPRPDWHADPSTGCPHGLRYVGLADALLDRIDAERERSLFTSLSDFTRRTGAHRRHRGAGHRGCVRHPGRDPPQRAVGRRRPARRPGRQAAGLVTGVAAPPLPGMTEVEETAADLWATG